MTAGCQRIIFFSHYKWIEKYLVFKKKEYVFKVSYDTPNHLTPDALNALIMNETVIKVPLFIPRSGLFNIDLATVTFSTPKSPQTFDGSQNSTLK